MIDCEAPLVAWQEIGKPKIHFKASDSLLEHLCALPDKYKVFTVPCGKCVLCRKRRAYEIGVRAHCEFATAGQSAFVTLTVRDEFIDILYPGPLRPSDHINHRPFQLFMKRLRKEEGVDCRYLMCGEFGETTRRPHYHAILFGWMPVDCYFDKRGCWHASETLEKYWPFGNVTCSPVNENRLMYVAGYCLKSSEYPFAPYVKWSRRPGLGAAFFDKYWRNIFERKVDWLKLDSGDLRKVDTYVQTFIVNRKKLMLNSRYFNERLQLHSKEKYDMMLTSKAELGRLTMQKEFSPLSRQSLWNKAEYQKLRLGRRKRELRASEQSLLEVGA